MIIIYASFTYTENIHACSKVWSAPALAGILFFVRSHVMLVGGAWRGVA
jgi:hypothetical protein